MSKTLIIAEKPSVATDLSRVLGKLPKIGKFTRKKGYLESDNAYISHAVGHLVQLKMPLTPEGKKLPWKMDCLPVIPTRFELQPIERNESQFKLLVRLLKKKDVTTVVNACDAGREGELIFRYVIQLADLKREFEIKRLWMQSMTDDSILQAWDSLRSDDEMDDLADAAICRSESDWLIGLNGTRALTAFNSRHGGFNVTSAGRVQTPTLTILAERELEIRSFVPKKYWEVHGVFGVTNGEYPGRWFNESFEKDENDAHRKAERMWTLEEAEAVVAACTGKTGIIEETKKPSRSSAPLLFDLSSLQREAGGKHGFTASRTLQLAQALYDRYKLTTYPRTESNCLPEDYVSTVKQTLKKFIKAKPNESFPEDFSKYSKWIIDNDKVQPNKRIFNNKKISDHFAIIPTGKLPTKALDEAARKVYDIIMRRFLAIFYPPAEFEVTKRITRVEEHAFETNGKVLVVPGYLEIYGRKPGKAAGATAKDELVAVTDGESATVNSVELKELETRPPARFNDNTLINRMKSAGKLVDDEELSDAMSERGLGTAATRANIIENLIRQKYIFRHELNRRDLVVSNKGLALIELLKQIGIETLSSPQMTGEWEYKLKQMEQGKLDRKAFMEEIKGLTKSIVKQTKDFTEVLVNRKFPDLEAPCPECDCTKHKQTDGTFECKEPECKFRLKKHIASHELTEEQAVELITNKKIGPIETFKNRFGQPFTAELTLEKPKKVWKVNFVFEGDAEREEELKNLSDDQLLCEAPILDGSDELIKVYDLPRAYVAPDMAKKKDERGVRISKTILQKEIPADQARKLFVEGKTDLMPGFVSKKGRKFSAHLKLVRETGKLEFEFAPRKKKVAAKGDKADGDENTEAASNGKKKKATKKKAAKKKPAVKKKKTAKKRSVSKKKAAAETPPDGEAPF